MKKLLIFSMLLFSSIAYSQNWQDVGGGSNNSSHGMLVWDGKLVNLGSYNSPCQRVSTWDGTSWNCLGGGVGIVARAGCVWQGKLVVIGDFWNVFQPCVGCNGVAVWDGVSWTALDQGFNNDVLTCTVWNGELIIAGDFTEANGVPISRVARWDELSSTFVGLGTQASFGNDIRCMTEFEGDLWVGGDFNNVDGCTACDGLVKWDDVNQVWEGGNSGVDLVGGVNESVRVLYVNPNDGNLYMGGEFPELIDGDALVQDFNMSGIAMYDGSNWFPLGTGLNEYCRAIHEYNGNLIAGGYFTDAGGTPANKIAKWNPIAGTWSAMGLGFDASGIDEYVKSAMVWNDIFFAGGAYTQAEGNPMNYIAQWFEPAINPPTAGISASSTSICEGECITFADMSINNPDAWTWDFPGGSILTSTDEDPGSVCFAAAGAYTVQLEACNVNGCDITTVDITVTAVPTLIVSDETICEGDAATLLATPSTGGGDFDWQPTGETTASISVSPITTSTYTVQYDLNGCLSAIENATVTVNPIPTLTMIDAIICEGEVAMIAATPDLSGGIHNWLTSGESTAAISVTPSLSTAYDVTYTLNGCQSATETVNVTVNLVYILSEDEEICFGSSITYPDGFSESLTVDASHISNLTSIDGCDSIITTNVIVLPLYSESEDVSICIGEDYTYPDGTVSLNILVDESHTSNLFSIDGCDSTVITNVTIISDYSVSEDVSICMNEDYTYPDGTTSSNIVTDESHVSNLFSVEGCDSTVTTNITVEPNPNIGVSENNNVLTADQASADYQWVDCSIGYADITGETNQTFSPTNNGSYAVIVTLNSCSDTSECISISTIGFGEMSATIKLYPMPVTDWLNVQSNSLNANDTYYIYDVKGALIQEGKLNSNFKVDMRAIQSGVYILQIKEYRQRLVKM